MMTALVILGILMIIFSAIGIWALICNERTYIQRMNMLPRPDDPDYWEKAHRFRSVDYDTHLVTLMMFKDAKELYK
jgi:hypothetical protein